MNNLTGARLVITGIVQGVGFRPFIYNLANQMGIKGTVRNTSAGVEILVDANTETLNTFIDQIQANAPPLAVINDVIVEHSPVSNFVTFEITTSITIPDSFQPISPDICVCSDCLREMFDPADRRYHYPFINCTNCGPRYTIIQDIPYDRDKTTMSGFPLCPDCAREYADPADRRFHAQPVACPVCGPKVWLEINNDAAIGKTTSEGDEAIIAMQNLLSSGKIVAIKGLGGFHLACDALNSAAVEELRERKFRVDKPFALMMADIETVNLHCAITSSEKTLLESPARPIVILKRKIGSPISSQVSPGQDTIGVMLPYTPLHYLLFSKFNQSSNRADPSRVLVMTSGNLREEPIVYDNQLARERLTKLADAFLMHNRPIYIRCDDSVVRAGLDGIAPLYPIRRSRGYVPYPHISTYNSPPILAVGSELKNTFCLARGHYAFVSHHVGDLENYETLTAFEASISHLEKIFKIKPEAIAYDLHPDYLATRYGIRRAEQENLAAIAIQHHHAHVAACLAENHFNGEEIVIGVSFDGTGFGDDGAIWGGEFLLANLTAYQRAGYLGYIPLPGGDRSIRKPARTALAHLFQAGIEWDQEIPSVSALCADERNAIRSQIIHKLNSPLTSSVGRLFDAVSSLVGVCQEINYEAQAAIELEALVDRSEEGFYPIDISQTTRSSFIKANKQYVVSPSSIIKAVVQDYWTHTPTSVIAARFHNTLALLAVEVCRLIRMDSGIKTVALSGGVWQNMTLLEKTINLLRDQDFHVITHSQVPTNDGGISLGQAAIAAYNLIGAR